MKITNNKKIWMACIALLFVCFIPKDASAYIVTTTDGIRLNINAANWAEAASTRSYSETLQLFSQTNQNLYGVNSVGSVAYTPSGPVYTVSCHNGVAITTIPSVQPYSQGSYPPYSQGSYPSYSQGSYPPYSQGSYPSYSQGSYPSYSQGAYCVANAGDVCQSYNSCGIASEEVGTYSCSGTCSAPTPEEYLCYAPPELLVNDKLVPLDTEFDISWDLGESDPSTCTLQGYGVDASYEIALPASTGVQTLLFTEPGSYEYTLSCPAGDTSATISTVPTIQES